MSTMETTSQIINKCFSAKNGISDPAKVVLPKQDALKKMIGSKRDESNVAPPTPLN